MYPSIVFCRARTFSRSTLSSFIFASIISSSLCACTSCSSYLKLYQ
jgi:hypothetical protein